MAVTVTLSPLGSDAVTVKVNVSPCRMQVSGGTTTTGGSLGHVSTLICMSRMTSPTMSHWPPTQRHSRMRRAMLYSPDRAGASHTTVPVRGST